jgi:hypothetical protein
MKIKMFAILDKAKPDTENIWGLNLRIVHKGKFLHRAKDYGSITFVQNEMPFAKCGSIFKTRRYFILLKPDTGF